ncbi:MAG: co-chaperone GroES [Phycisphaerae bacterium]|nr:co-chaperone GroES [Phycisphaerae bacterium]
MIQTIDLDRIEPMTDRVLVELHTKETTSAGGIVIPDGSQKQRGIARVVKLGPDAQGKGIDIGDDINASRTALESYPVDEFGKLMRIIRFGEIQAVIKPKASK